MGTDLQVLFFACMIVLQAVLITIIIKGFKTFQETADFLKQKVSEIEFHSCGEQKVDGENGIAKRTEQEIGKVEKKKIPCQIPSEEKFLFKEQVKLDRRHPIAEVNIIADGKEK